MNELIQYFQDFFGSYVTQARAAINASLASLPPLEQVEAASEAGYALRQAKYCADSMLSSLSEVDASFTAILAEARAGTGVLVNKVTGVGMQLAQAEVAGKLTGGELVLKADFLAAIENARTQSVLAEQASASAALVQSQLISNRRTELVAAGLSEPLLDSATAANAELLTGDDYKAMAGKVIDRVGKLKALGIQSEAVLKDFAGIAVNQEGDAEFARRFDLQQQIATDIQGSKPAANRAPFIAGVLAENSGPKLMAVI